MNTFFTLRNDVYALMHARITDALNFFALEFGRAQIVIRLVDLTWLFHIRIVSIKFSDVFRRTFMGSLLTRLQIVLQHALKLGERE